MKDVRKTELRSRLLQLANAHSVWLVTLVLAILPLSISEKGLAIEILIFGLFALSFNMLFGYAGLVSFGHAMFFGLGSYSAALTLIHVQANLWLALLAGVVVSVLTASLIGWFCLRRRALYFAMLSLAFGQMTYFIAYQASPITGGFDGLRGVPIPRLQIPGLLDLDIDPIFSPLTFYYLVLFLLVLCMVAMHRIVESPFGRSLQAIRESEERARACGYDTNRLQYLAFLFAGIFAGLAGGLNAVNLGFVGLESLGWMMSGTVLLVSILGGRRTFFGPFIGAAVYLLIAQYGAKYWSGWQIVVGVIFVLCVMFLPEGIWGTLATWRPLVVKFSPPATVAARDQQPREHAKSEGRVL